MYHVDKGKVSLFRLMPSGDEKLFKVFMAGGVIAEMAMFMAPRKYPMSARVEQETVLSAFHHQHLKEVITNSPELSVKVMCFMGNRVFQLMNNIDILTQVNASQRLIMKLAGIYKSQPTKKGKVVIPATKKLLAAQLGMTPETLSRVIKKLKKTGLLKESGNSFYISDIARLCQQADLATDLFDC